MGEGSESPSASTIQALPIWARVAFAARCALRVRTIFSLAVPHPTAESRQAFADALEIACATPIKKGVDGAASARFSEVVTELGRVKGSSAKAYFVCQTVIAAAMTAFGYATYQHSRELEVASPGGPHGMGASLARTRALTSLQEAIHFAMQAAADAAAEESALPLSDSNREALAATITARNKARRAMSSSIASDFAAIRKAAELGKWTDDTPVDPGENGPIGPLWPLPNGEPDWKALAAEAQSEKVEAIASTSQAPGEITLHLPIPPLPDSPEVRALVVERLRVVVHELSAAYIAAGGSGLLVKDAELHIEVPALVPAGGGGGGL